MEVLNLIIKYVIITHLLIPFILIMITGILILIDKFPNWFTSNVLMHIDYLFIGGSILTPIVLIFLVVLVFDLTVSFIKRKMLKL